MPEPLILNGEPLILSDEPAVDESCVGCCDDYWCVWGVYKDVANAGQVGSAVVGAGAVFPYTDVYTNTQKWYLVKVNLADSVNSFPDWAVELPALGAFSQAASYDWQCQVWSTLNSVFIFSDEEPRVVKVSIGGESVSWASSALTGFFIGPFSGTDDTSLCATSIVSGGTTVVDPLIDRNQGALYRLAVCENSGGTTYECLPDPDRYVSNFYTDDSAQYAIIKFLWDWYDVNEFFAPYRIDAGLGGPSLTTMYDIIGIVKPPDCLYDSGSNCLDGLMPYDNTFAVEPTDFADPLLHNPSADDLDDFQWSQQFVTGALSGLDVYLSFREANHAEFTETYVEWEMFGGPNLTFRQGHDINDVDWSDPEPNWGAHRTARGGTCVIAPNSTSASAQLHVYIDGGSGVPLVVSGSPVLTTGDYEMIYFDSSDEEIYARDLGVCLDYSGNVITGCVPSILIPLIRHGIALIKLSADRSSPTVAET